MAARTKRTFEELLEETRELLFEPTVAGVIPFWTETNLKNIMNQQKDQIEMYLVNTLEQFNTTTFSVEFEADQRAYSLPSDFLKLHRVLRRTTEGVEFPLLQDKMQSGRAFTTNTDTNSSNVYAPSVRVQGTVLILSYPPVDSDAGFLVIEYDASSPRLVAEGQKLPEAWPLSVESALVLRTAAAAVVSEGAEAMISNQRTRVNDWRSEAQEYLANFVQMSQRRFHGKVRGKGLHLGG